MAQQFLKGKQIAQQTITISGNTGNVIMSGELDTHGNVIIGNYTPESGFHLTNKDYVDAVAQGLHPHPPVKIVTTGDTTLSGLYEYDGYQLLDTDRVLVIGQLDATENGIYVASGDTWLRAEDADGTPDHEVQTGDFVFVEEGTVNGKTGWILYDTNATDPSNIQPGTDTQLWTKIAAPGTYSADGEGIILSGTEFRLDLDGNTLSKSVSGLKVADSVMTAITNNTTDITSLETEIDNEVSDRIYGDESLASAISDSTADLTSLETAVDGEISDRVYGDESLEAEISSLQGEVVDIEDILNDGELLGMVGGELSGVTNIQQDLSTAIDNEVSDRIYGDESLASAISDSTADLTSLETAVDGEISDRVYGDGSLATEIDNEVSDRIYGDESLATEIDNEVSDRIYGDESLATEIDNEVSDRIVGDGSLATEIDNEVSDRIYGDESLASAISDSTADLTSLETAVDGEISDRIAGDGSLATEIDNEVSDRIYGDGSLATEIDNEVSDRIYGDGSLATEIDNEVSNRIVGDGSLATEIDSEVSDRIYGDGSLATAIEDLTDPEFYKETIVPENSGETTATIVKTSAFGYGMGTIDEESIFVFLNGIQYSFNYTQGTTVFHTDGTTPTGGGTTLYFDGNESGFEIETDDHVILKYMVSS